ncbi:unnamed protein product [Darwinula stevensoni]|uniref:Uncharacterized protein n=1 Tax=Darwinula stevensoni TaxID=69355 RepID=A0A7R9A6U3_9CRUS|nr:unnamed protein product [Darwinula stevensoni]CAG0888972.1 unnamed protein product [Darwinula stevensoni]
MTWPKMLHTVSEYNGAPPGRHKAESRKDQSGRFKDLNQVENSAKKFYPLIPSSWNNMCVEAETEEMGNQKRFQDGKPLKEYSFIEGAKKYQETYYPDAEMSYAFPAGYVLSTERKSLRDRAQQMAERGEPVLIVNMSEGVLTRYIQNRQEYLKFKDKIRVVNYTQFSGSSQPGIGSLLENCNSKREMHVLVDEMPVNWGMEESESEEIGRCWKDFAGNHKCLSVWIAWRPSDASYRETLDLQGVIDSLGREKVELLVEVKRSTKETGQFVTEVTRFIPNRFPCLNFLPMQGLEFGASYREVPGGVGKLVPRVVYVKASPKDKLSYLWASEAAVAIKSSLTDSLYLTIITKMFWERDVLVRDIGDRLGKGVAFLDSNGNIRGHSNPGFLIFYERQHGQKIPSCHHHRPIALSHWEEPERLGLVSIYPLRELRPTTNVSAGLLDESSYAEISWAMFMEPDCPNPHYSEIDERKFELLFGSNRSGKTTFLLEKLMWKVQQEKIAESTATINSHIMLVDCSRWNRHSYPRSLSTTDLKEKLKMRGMNEEIEVFDIHDLFQQLGNIVSLSPRVIEQLLMNMLEKGQEDGRRIHIAFHDAPVHPIDGDTDVLSDVWESIFGSLSRFQDSLASLTIAFQSYTQCSSTRFDLKRFFCAFLKNVHRHFEGDFEFTTLPYYHRVRILEGGWRDVGFPRLLHHILSHESPDELRMIPVTLTMRPEVSSLVFGEKPTLITPPLATHYHGGFKCISGQGRGCVAITAAAFMHSYIQENVVVLISDEMTREIFTDALKLMKTTKVPEIFSPSDFRGCESPQVMCVGVEDSCMIEGISRAIRTLFIVEGGTHTVVQSRIKLWREMERRGLLVHRPLVSSAALDTFSTDDWRSLNRKCSFLKVQFSRLHIRNIGMEDGECRETSCCDGKQRIFAMGRGKKGIPGILEVLKSDSTLWVPGLHSAEDVFLAHSGRLIHGRQKDVRILHVEGKDPCEASFRWDEVLRIPPQFFIKSTTGVVIQDSLFLFGGEGNSPEGCRLDLNAETWTTLSPLREKRNGAASMMLDPHTILVLGGWDSETQKALSSSECLDTRTLQWSHFPPIPIALSSHAVAVYNEHLYISGGFSEGESQTEVWRWRVNGGGPWEKLLPLNIGRHDHGFMEDGAGTLSVIGGRQRRGQYDVFVLETEKLTLNGEIGWVTQEKLPFMSVLKANEME